MKQCVIGVDLGGTNTVFGVVDARGEIIEQSSISTGKYATVEEYVAVLAPELKKLIEGAGGLDAIRGIGIGAPNANFYKGTIEDSVNIPWAKGKVVPFAQLISDAIGLPVALTNDANAAAIGEMTYGVAKGMKNFIMITLGTGVGSGVVVNGQLVYGHDGFAGELGHVIVNRQNGRICGCGRRGCLEAYASARGMALTAREIVEAGREDTLLSSCNLETLTSKDVYDMAKKGDKAAQGVFDYTGKILGEAFADFIAFSSPEAIVLFGGPTKAGDLIMNPIREAMENSVLGIFKGKTQVLLSQLPESDAAVLGASALAWDL